MMKPIPKLPFDVEGAEEHIRECLKFIPRVRTFDAILQHYLEERASAKSKMIAMVEQNKQDNPFSNPSGVEWYIWNECCDKLLEKLREK